MKILNDIINLVKIHVEVVTVNSLSTITLIVAWLNSFSGFLTVMVLLSTFVYNLIRIYQALTKDKKKKSEL